MLKKDITLSEVLDYYKKNKAPSFDEELDQFGEYFITAGRIAAVILQPTPVVAIASFCAGIDAASLKASKLLSWLPDKYKYKEKRREVFAVERYELASVVNFLLLQIAIKNSVKEVIMPTLSKVMEHVKFEEADEKELNKAAKECDREISNMKLPTFCVLSKTDLETHSFKIFDPVFSTVIKLIDKTKEENPTLKKIDLAKVREKYLNKVTVYYDAFVINFSGEFPEFALWAQTEQKSIMLRELKELSKKIDASDKNIHDHFINQTEQLLKKIEELRNPKFISENGFPSFDESYKKLFQLQSDKFVNINTSRVKENIDAHHNKIRTELNSPLIDNQDIEGIIYPRNNEIYIAQSFQSLNYRKKDHKKVFLTATSHEEFTEKGENIGNYLLQTLVDPNYASKPIILLGNPGAGKSMFSKMFAGILSETTDFIPFLIKLRSVASNTANISEHINKGLSKYIQNTSDINWLEWAKEFRERIPVIIMDGFDELMQSSNTELNNYLNTIKEFQDSALTHGIAVRVILTSRITVMQDVSIPEGTKIIKLDSFDQQRRDLWVYIWNKNQIKPDYEFTIPKNEKIEHLAQEPLLMFMLAVYDFEKSELLDMTKDRHFNQSKLYDSLLNSFTARQLKKNDRFLNASRDQQIKEEELLRLRLGMIALMMFLNDTTHKDTQKLNSELEAFGFHESQIQTDKVLGDFFFIHENMSTTEGEVEKLHYEFLHKTFGEFLAADFMLRVASKQCERSREKIHSKHIFNFCFGYNWLHKHNNIQNFLFEHGPQIIKHNGRVHEAIVNDLIKPDIEALFDNDNIEFPVKENQIQPHKQVVEHLAIYSQNLIFLWLSISKEKEEIKFEIFGSDEKTGDGSKEHKYESQDRDETNKNKLLWKRLTKLWSLVGNYNAAAKLSEWVKVVEIDNAIVLRKQRSNVTHNFSDSAKIGCNDFELLLSFFDHEYKFASDINVLEAVSAIVKKKPELSALAIDSMLYRYHDLYRNTGFKLFEWFTKFTLSKRQQVSLLKRINASKWHVHPETLLEMVKFFTKETNFAIWENPHAIFEFMKTLITLKSYYPISEIVEYEYLEDGLHKFSSDMSFIDSESPLVILEYIKLVSELNRNYYYRRKFKGSYVTQALLRLTKNIDKIIFETPYSAFEFLKLLNELREYLPERNHIHPDLLEDALLMLSKNIKYIARQNPHAILEYLKLLYDSKNYLQNKKKLPFDYYEPALIYLSEEWGHILQDENFNLLEYLKFIIELKHYHPLEKIIPSHLIEESISRISHEMYFLLSEHSKNAEEHFQLLKDFIRSFRVRDFRRYQNGNFFDEAIYRLSKEIDIDSKADSQVLLIYMELLFMSGGTERQFEKREILEQLIGTLSKRSFGNRTILKATLLLLRYKADPRLITTLLDKNPKIRQVYLNSPETAKDILEALNELTSHERNN